VNVIKWKLGVALFLLLFFPLLSQGNIVIAVDQANPPFMYRDGQTGIASGFYPLLITAVFKRAGIPVSVVAYPWKRALTLGESGETGIGGIYDNEQRRHIFDYSDPLYTEKVVIYTRKGQPLFYKNIDSLNGKRIGVIRGWSYGDSFDQARAKGRFVIDESVSDVMNFQKLIARNEIDAILTIDKSGEKCVKEIGAQNKVEKEKINLSELTTHIVFAKKLNRKAVINDLNKALAAIKSDGTYRKIERESL
jgi:polar amino acid transport system substrate-binding protein